MTPTATPSELSNYLNENVTVARKISSVTGSNPVKESRVGSSPSSWDFMCGMWRSCFPVDLSIAFSKR